MLRTIETVGWTDLTLKVSFRATEQLNWINLKNNILFNKKKP